MANNLHYETSSDVKIWEMAEIEGLDEAIYNIFADNPELRNEAANILAKFHYDEMLLTPDEPQNLRFVDKDPSDYMYPDDYVANALQAIENLSNMKYYSGHTLRAKGHGHEEGIGGVFAPGRDPLTGELSFAVPDTSFVKSTEMPVTALHEGLAHGTGARHHQIHGTDRLSRNNYEDLTNELTKLILQNDPEDYKSLVNLMRGPDIADRWYFDYIENQRRNLLEEEGSGD